MEIVLFCSIILGFTLYVWLTGFKKDNVESKSDNLGNKYIDLAVVRKDNVNSIEVLYDKNTKVMYFAKDDSCQFCITPIYNSDGTLKLYDGQ